MKRTESHFVKYENDQWITPQRAPFSNNEYSENNPFFSQSGNTLYFY